MKKFKGFLATALLALTVLAVSLSVLACDNNGGENYTLAVDPATVTVTAGENVTLSTNAPEGTQLKWKSSDENVATVAAGIVTGINAGAAKIIVQAGSQSAECSSRARRAGCFDRHQRQYAYGYRGGRAHRVDGYRL